jgi:hypothetical protein
METERVQRDLYLDISKIRKRSIQKNSYCYNIWPTWILIVII